jgi:DNA repair exonuclease SbcCD ATPase subunit
MARPANSTANEVRSAVLALLREADIDGAPTAQSFRRAVSVRRVRARLGGGNLATIGREINRLEAELVEGDPVLVGMPDIPADVATLMAQLWQAAVGVQLDAVVKLQDDAKAVAEGARSELVEAQLRTQVLLQELTEMRAAAADKDTQLAQALSAQASLSDQVHSLQADLAKSHAHSSNLATELEKLQAAQSESVTTARERYDGLSKQLLQETAQQRQLAQQEVSRLTSQLKFAEKREATLLGRSESLEAELQETRTARDKASGEVAALRYVTTSLRAQLDEYMRARPTTPKIGADAPAKQASKKRGATPLKDLVTKT